MGTVKLIYAEKGIEITAEAKYPHDVEYQKKLWKRDYGKLYDRCIVVEEGVKKIKRVKFIPTGEIYETAKLAADTLGYTPQLISFHALGRLTFKRTERLFEYIEDEAA